MSEEGRFTIHVDHQDGYEFKVRFDWDQVPELLLDEPRPLGGARGPNAARMLAAAAANCLSASLLFCVSKDQASPASIQTTVTGRIYRNDQKRLRISGLDVRIQVSGEMGRAARMRRCLDLFEDFCVVTASIRQGIAVSVEVVGEDGESLHRSQ
jgi:organic hydroperoxide reductase OsmC/OhrA